MKIKINPVRRKLIFFLQKSKKMLNIKYPKINSVFSMGVVRTSFTYVFKDKFK